MARELLEEFLITDTVNIIINYLGNECDKCKSISETPLTICLSFKNGNYSLTDIPHSNYMLKKFCKKCIYSRCSSVKIYVEIHD